MSMALNDMFIMRTVHSKKRKYKLYGCLWMATNDYNSKIQITLYERKESYVSTSFRAMYIVFFTESKVAVASKCFFEMLQFITFCR